MNIGKEKQSVGWKKRDNNMKDNKLQTLIGILSVIILGISGWLLITVANIPKEYATKEEMQDLRIENREDHIKIQSQLEVLLKELYQHSYPVSEYDINDRNKRG